MILEILLIRRDLLIGKIYFSVDQKIMNDYFSSVFNWLLNVNRYLVLIEVMAKKDYTHFWPKDISHFGLKNTQILKLGQFSFTIQIRIE